MITTSPSLTSTASSTPHVSQVALVTLARFPHIAGDAQPSTDLLELVRQNGLVLGTTRESVRIVRADAQLAARFNVNKGTRLLELDRVTLASNGVPIERRVSFTLPRA